MLYHKLIEEHVDVDGNVLSDGKQSYSYFQIHERVMEIRASFEKMDLQVGSRVLITATNCIETILTVLACIADGYIFVLLYPEMSEMEKEQIRRNCTPDLCVDGITGFISREKFRCVKERTVLPEDTLVSILYTSGSDGFHKGVVASQKQILFCCTAINQRLMNTERDRILCCLPLAFDYGLYQVFLAFLNCSLLYIAKGVVLQKIPKMLSEWKITAFPIIPSVMNVLIKTSLLKGLFLPELRYITFTGERLSVKLIDELMKLFPKTEVVPMYGLTECKRVSIMPFGRNDKKKQGSCGLPLAGVRVWLADVDPKTGIGELVVNGPNVMEGYWGELGKSGEVYRTNSFTGERFIYTGDLFRIDTEGFLYFCGRKSRIIKVKGYRISCVRIEKLLEKLETIDELAVLGIEDQYSGEKPAIFVCTGDEQIRERVCEIMKKQPRYMRNYELFVQKNSLPKTSNGKIDVLELKKRLQNCAE